MDGWLGIWVGWVLITNLGRLDFDEKEQSREGKARQGKARQGKARQGKATGVSS